MYNHLFSPLPVSLFGTIGLPCVRLSVCKILFPASWKNCNSYITQTFHKCLLRHKVIAHPFQFHLPPMSRSHLEVKGKNLQHWPYVSPLLVDGFSSYFDTRSVLRRPFLWHYTTPMSMSHLEVKGQKLLKLVINSSLVNGFSSYFDTRLVLTRLLLW